MERILAWLAEPGARLVELDGSWCSPAPGAGGLHELADRRRRRSRAPPGRSTTGAGCGPSTGRPESAGCSDAARVGGDRRAGRRRCSPRRRPASAARSGATVTSYTVDRDRSGAAAALGDRRRVAGPRRGDFSVVVKVVRTRRRRRPGRSCGWPGADPSHRNYWKREWLAFSLGAARHPARRAAGAAHLARPPSRPRTSAGSGWRTSRDAGRRSGSSTTTTARRSTWRPPRRRTRAGAACCRARPWLLAQWLRGWVDDARSPHRRRSTTTSLGGRAGRRRWRRCDRGSATLWAAREQLLDDRRVGAADRRALRLLADQPDRRRRRHDRRDRLVAGRDRLYCSGSRPADPRPGLDAGAAGRVARRARGARRPGVPVRAALVGCRRRRGVSCGAGTPRRPACTTARLAAFQATNASRSGTRPSAASGGTVGRTPTIVAEQGAGGRARPRARRVGARRAIGSRA